MATRKAKPKKNRTGLLGKTRGMLRVSLKQSKRKSAKSGYVAPKKRTGANAAAKTAANATVKSRTVKKMSSFGKFKLAAKQKALNLKGSVKSAGRKGGKMSAAHRKAISDGLRKRFGFGRKK